MKVTIENYNPRWAARFESERSRIAVALQSIDHSIEHVGSTAVVGLAAKPIVDVLIGVASNEDLDRTIAPMIALDYYYIKFWEFTEGGFPGRRFFVKLVEPAVGIERIITDQSMPRPSEARTHHVHLVVKDTDFWNRHLLFRDILRSDKSIRTAYESLKRRLAEGEWASSNDYAKAKTDFIQGVLAQASTRRRDPIDHSGEHYDQSNRENRD